MRWLERRAARGPARSTGGSPIPARPACREPRRPRGLEGRWRTVDLWVRGGAVPPQVADGASSIIHRTALSSADTKARTARSSLIREDFMSRFAAAALVTAALIAPLTCHAADAVTDRMPAIRVADQERGGAPARAGRADPAPAPGARPGSDAPETIVGTDLTGPITAADRARFDAMDMGELGRLCDRRNGTTRDVPRSSWTPEQHRGRHVCQGPRFGEGG